MAEPAIFIDRDGTINKDIGYVSRPDELLIYPFAAAAIRRLNEAGLKVIIITNQSGIARGLYSEATLDAIHERLKQELRDAGAKIDAVYYCPHHPQHGNDPYRKVCDCRKPQIAMLERAAAEYDIDLSASYVIGDKASDINLATNAGARGVLVMTGYGAETYANLERFPCYPTLIAKDLREAAALILTEQNANSRD